MCHRILSIQGTWAFLAALSYDGMPNLALLPSCLIIAACARQAGPPIAASALRWVSPPDKVSAANVAPPAAAAIITTHRPRPCRLPPPSVKPGIVCPFAQAPRQVLKFYSPPHPRNARPRPNRRRGHGAVEWRAIRYTGAGGAGVIGACGHTQPQRDGLTFGRLRRARRRGCLVFPRRYLPQPAAPPCALRRDGPAGDG